MATKSWKTGINGNWTTAADWTPGAVPGAADDAVISVAGAYTVSATSISVAARSLTIGDSRAVLAITGGAAPASLKTTAAGSNAGSIVLSGKATLTAAGFVNNGVIAVNNDVFGAGDAGGGGATLAGTLTNNGDLDIGNSALATATTVTAAGLSNAAGATISLTGGAAQATLNITGAAPTALTGFVYIEGNAALQYKSGGIKSIAANSELSLDGAKARVALAGAPGTSSALAGLGVNNGILNLENYAAVKTTVGFTNNDTLWIDAGEGDGGSRLTLGGALTNNDFLDIGNDASRQATTVSATSLVNNASVEVTGGAGRTSLVIAGAAPTTLIGSYRLEGNAVIDFGSGGIKTISADAGLLLDGPRARMALGNDTTKNGALAALTGNFGSFTIGDGSVSIAGSLFNSGQLIVDGFGGGFGITNNRGGSNLTIGATLTNSGILNIGNSGIFLPTTVKAAALVNNTAINLTGAAAVQATLAITAAAPTTLTGDYFLVGDALLQYGSGAIKAIGALAELSLDGKLSRVDVAGGGGGSGNVGGAAAPLAAAAGPSGSTALTTLAANAGTFALADGASVATTTPFNNSGSLQVDASGAGGSSLTIGGKLTNSSTVTIGNAGILTATNVKAAGLANTGAIGLTGAALVQATLNITTAASTTLTGNFNLKGDALLQYASGAIKGIGLGSSLSLDGAKSRVGIGATAGNTALTTLAVNAGTFALADGAALTTTVAFNNAGTTQVDSGFGNAGGSSLVIGKGLTNAGSLQIGNAGIVTAVKVTAAALTNTGTLQLTGGGAAATLTAASVVNSGTISLTSGAASAALKVTGAFGNSSTGSVRVDAGFGGGGSILTVGGTLTNSGFTFQIGNSSLAKATTVTAAGLVNTGTITLIGAAAVQATLKVAAAAPANLTGNFNLSGDALLQYASGAITGIGGGSQLSLDGKQARVAVAAAPGSNSALTKLAGNAGALSLADSASLTTLAGIAFNNTGAMGIDTGFGGGGSSLAIGGALTNSGFNFQIGNTGLAKAATVTAASVANSGTISLASGAASAALKVAAAFNNTGTVQVDAGFGGGGSSLTIGGALTNSGFNFRIGNSNLAKATTMAAASVVNSGAISLASGAASAALKVTGAFGNSPAGSVQVDAGFGGGGSILTIGGTLTNGGNLTIGNGGLTRATTATVAKLANTGAIDLTGAAAVQAALKVGAAAPATLTGNSDLVGNALLQYASGAITAIGLGAGLSLDGTKSRVALAATPGSNSALTKLAANAGTLSLADGASLTTLAGIAFNNTGTTRIDTGFGGGGSSLAIGGALKNNGTLQIGNGGLTAAVTVTAASLVNNSSSNISVQGGTGVNIATLKAAGASTDAGGISINGGGILALGGKLTVTGSLFVGDGGAISGGTLSGPGSMTSSAFSTTSTLNNVTIDAGATFADNGGVLTVAGVVVNGVLKGNFTTLDFGKPGTDSMINVQGFSTIGLANGGANTLTLTDLNFAGLFGNPITVNGGGSGNTVNGAGLTGTNAIVVHAGPGTDALKGGAGNDIFFAGGKTNMTGGLGANEFTFAAPGATNVVADFALSATNEAVVSNSGFSLGLSGASSFPQALPAGLFAANATGSFTSAAQRFAYNTTSGALRFDADGSGAASSPQLVATLTSHPSLANLFFVS